MGKSRIIFEEDFSQPLFKDIDFDQIHWRTTSLPTSGMYKVSSDDMLFKRKVRAKTHLCKSVNGNADVTRTWASNSYTGEVKLTGYQGEDSYEFVIEFESGHLIEIKQI